MDGINTLTQTIIYSFKLHCLTEDIFGLRPLSGNLQKMRNSQYLQQTGITIKQATFSYLLI